MHISTVSTPRTQTKRTVEKWIENDKFLRSKGLKHLAFDILATREERVLRELTGLRRDLQTTKFLQVTEHSGFVAVNRRYRETSTHDEFKGANKKWVGVTQSYKKRIEYVTAPSEFGTTVSMAAEHKARRRERELTRELAQVDALWLERGKALSNASRRTH